MAALDDANRTNNDSSDFIEEVMEHNERTAAENGIPWQDTREGAVSVYSSSLSREELAEAYEIAINENERMKRALERIRDWSGFRHSGQARDVAAEALSGR